VLILPILAAACTREAAGPEPERAPEHHVVAPPPRPVLAEAPVVEEPEVDIGDADLGDVVEVDHDSSGDIPDEVDRCPDVPVDSDEDDIDGCPEPAAIAPGERDGTG
jgi:hypothetical protein